MNRITQSLRNSLRNSLLNSLLNRAFLGLGYNFNEALQIQAGYMNTFRHHKAPHIYESRNIIRFSVYHHLDFHLEIQPKARDIPIH